MSVSNPKSSDFLMGSSLGFKKPMPRRESAGRGEQGDSSEFDVDQLSGSPDAALELWRRLQPDPDDPNYAPDSCSGIMLGHFRVEERIGRGGMGAVFRATDTRLDRDVALKVLAGSQLTDRSSVDRFLNEARAAARLDHDNVARVYYVGQDHGLHFIAFEFIHGMNVRQLIDARGTLSPSETLNYGLQIAHALRHVAAAGVVHRDIKPSNIIITPTGRAKLVDLGLARKLDPEASKDLTVDGTTLGTFDYISPEQAKDPRSVDIRSDIYSLGCTMYHMLTGEPPYPRGTMLQKLLDHQHKDVPDASSRNRNVPPEMSAVVRKMMAADPDARYESAEDLISDLSILAHAYGLRPMAAESMVWSVPQRPTGWTLLRRYRAWIATAALLIVGVVLFDMLQPAPIGSVADTADAAAVASSDATEQLETGEVVGPVLPPASETTDDESFPTASLSSLGGGLDVSSDDGDPSFRLNGDLTESGENMAATVAPAGRTPDVLSPDRNPLSDVNGTPVFTPNGIPPLIAPFTLGANPAIGSTNEPPSQTAAVPDTTTPEPTAEPEITTPESSSAFLVRVDGEAPREFASLEAACSAAPDGSAIELNFDGPSVERQRPVKVVGKRLRLRAVPGRSPIIRFAVPNDWRNAEIVRMISVTRGSLEVYNVGFEVVVDPNFIAEGWVLLALSQADEVILRGVAVTMQNPKLRSAAIVELAQKSSRFDGRMPEVMDAPPVRIEAEDCLFRGEADLFGSANYDPARIRLSNVAVALDGSLIHLRGVDAMEVPTDAGTDRRVEMDLRHLTALLTGNLVRFQIDTGRTVPRVSVSANNSVLVNGASPLVSISGDLDTYDARQLLEWSGDHSFVHSQDPVWRIQGPIDDWDCTLEEWNELWRQGRLERPEGTNLLRRDRSIPYHQMTQADLGLVVSAETPNPAIDGASDGTDAGVQWSSPRLPLVPDDGAQ